MSSRFRSTAAFLAISTLTLAACDDDPYDPCADLGCGVEGVDLALAIAQIDWTSGQRVDSRVGGRLVQPGDPLRFRYHVVNRGTEPSDPAVLFVGTWHKEGNLGVDHRFHEWIEIPSLEPRESFEGRVTKIAPNTVWLHTDQRVAEILVEGEHGGPWFDADQSNHRATFEYHVALPYVTVDAQGSVDTLVLGSPRAVDVTVRNESPVATLPSGADVTVCLGWLEEYGGAICSTEPIVLQQLLGLQPGETATTSGTVVFSSEDIVYAKEELRAGQPLLHVCVEHACDEIMLPGIR